MNTVFAPRRRRAMRLPAPFPVIAALLTIAPAVAVDEVAAQAAFLTRCGAGAHVDAGTGWISVPQGEIFCPLAADPKAERSFVSYLRGDFATIADPPPGAKSNIGAVGLGDSFALFRYQVGMPGEGIQVGLAGAVFSQFDLDQRSFDLVNADYLVGIPVTVRKSAFSARLRLYHQSSHLGDEFLLNRQPERINLSFESFEMILSQEMRAVRIYAGGEVFFRREPADLASRLIHAGLEVRPVIFSDGRILAAFDYKLIEEDTWAYAWNARAGLELARIPAEGHPPRVISLVVDVYRGAAPYGQFYRENIRYVGVGIHLSR